jgi:mannose/fructose/N-acetylgalactosamine-specific phosphotransferase system component IIB
MMDVQLFRIDDRLIHGQVVIGWAKYLKSKRILLCDEEVEQNEWEKELYLSCVPNQLQAIILGLDNTAKYLTNSSTKKDKTIVLVKSPQVVRQLIYKGYIPERVNLGGIHFAENRKKYLSYLYLSADDIEDLMYMLDKNIDIYCQDIPTGKRYDIRNLLRKYPHR